MDTTPDVSRADVPVVAYVMTHYPHPSHSFLLQEIMTVQSLGARVVPVAVNVAEDAHVLTEVDAAERRRTFYVKGVGPLRAIARILPLALRHPLRTTGYFVAAARSGGTDPAVALKRVLQAVEGLLVWQHGRRQGVEHVHAHFARMPAFVARFAVESSRRFGDRTWTWSVTVHGPHDFMNEFDAGLDVVTREADAIVAISSFASAQLMRLAPPDRRDAVHVVRCGIDLDRFPRRREPEPHPGLRLLNVGRLAPEKGQWVLLEALAEVRARGVDATLRIIGDGPLRSDLEAQIRTLGLTDHVEFLGNVPQTTVRAELERADVYCMPSFAEGLPISIMEALAVGVPVVVTSIAGIPELVADGVTGRCVPAGDVRAFADAVVDMAESAGRRAEMVDAGRQRVEALHQAHRSAALLLDVFAAVRQDRASHRAADEQSASAPKEDTIHAG